MRSGAPRPTIAELDDARHHLLPDVLAPALDVVFCGINPGLYSTAVGHHFARPGNRFWPTLHRAGFTPGVMSPLDDATLLDLGYGLTNVCRRTTARADELTPDELRAGARLLRGKILRFQPRFLAVVGFTAFRTAFDRPGATGGRQQESIGDTTVWLLPNPSGLNAHHPVTALATMFGELAQAVAGSSRHRGHVASSRAPTASASSHAPTASHLRREEVRPHLPLQAPPPTHPRQAPPRTSIRAGRPRR